MTRHVLQWYFSFSDTLFFSFLSIQIMQSDQSERFLYATCLTTLALLFKLAYHLKQDCTVLNNCPSKAHLLGLIGFSETMLFFLWVLLNALSPQWLSFFFFLKQSQFSSVWLFLLLVLIVSIKGTGLRTNSYSECLADMEDTGLQYKKECVIVFQTNDISVLKIKQKSTGFPSELWLSHSKIPKPCL